jgi:hypothetical protein
VQAYTVRLTLRAERPWNFTEQVASRGTAAADLSDQRFLPGFSG